jgi:hypothetical protein
LAIAKGRTDLAPDWNALAALGVTITQDIDEARDFFLRDIDPAVPFPLDRQWIAATKKLANDINARLQQWPVDGGALILETNLALNEITKPLPISHGLALDQQRDFVQGLEMPDLRPSRLLIVQGEPLLLLRNIKFMINYHKYRPRSRQRSPLSRCPHGRAHYPSRVR